MASSDNITSFETWAFRSSLENSWFSEAFARDTEALTEALTHSITNGLDTKNVSLSETPYSFPSVQTVSSSGGSDPEKKSISKRSPRNAASGKITKRKSRVSKRSPTTFISADPDNFRQMVQQVTGVEFGSGQVLIFKPEAHRAGFGSGLVNLLPTLDTSTILLDHHQQVVRPASVGGISAQKRGFGPNVGEVGRPGFDFDGLSSCFPTLESWKVM